MQAPLVMVRRTTLRTPCRLQSCRVPGHIFVSYVREDAAHVQRLVAALEALGFSVWLDRARLAPGDRWRDAIRHAIRDGDLFIACFSHAYAQRDRTHMNEELTLAIEELRSRPTSRAWFIPVIVAGGDVPDRLISPGESLRDLQWVNLDENWDDGLARIAYIAIQKRLATLRTTEGSPGEASGHSRAAGGVIPILAKRDTPEEASLAPPTLRLLYTLQAGKSYWRYITHQELRIHLMVLNDSPTAAVAPYLRIQVPSSFAIGPLGITSLESNAPLQLIPEAVQPPAAVIVGKPDFVIHPHTSFQVLEVTSLIRANVNVPECEIRFKAACSNSATQEGAVRIFDFEIAGILKRPIHPYETV